MRYVEAHPAADLAPYVHCLWELDAAGATLVEPIFPDGRLEIVFHLADRPARIDSSVAQPRMMVVGQMTTAVRLAPVPHLHTIGIRFTHAGARACFAMPLRELTSHFEDAHGVLGAAAGQLQAAVENSNTPSERFARIEGVLRANLHSSRLDRVVAHATRAIAARHGSIPVDAVARLAGLSPRQLERRFLDAVGLPPKTFARTVRLQAALAALRGGMPAAAVAPACGYADQAHLAREFRRVAGVPAREVDLARVAFVQDDRETRRAQY